MGKKISKAKLYVQAKMDGANELEALRASGLTEETLKKSHAGLLGAEESNRVQHAEERRQKAGRELQPGFDMVKNEVRAELANFEGTKPGIDVQALFSFAVHIIEDVGWQREYPTSDEIIDEEYERHRDLDATLTVDESVVQQEQKFHGCWLNAAAYQIVDESVHVQLEKLPLFKKLVIRALEQFVELVGKDEKTRNGMNRSFPRLPEQIKACLRKIENDTNYEGPWIPPKTHQPTVQQITEHRKYYEQGPGLDSASLGLTKATLRAAAEKQERLEAEAAENRERDRILKEAREREAQQLQQMAPDAFEFLRRGR